MSAPARDTATQPATQFLVADIQGTELTDADRIRLTHPALAGVICLPVTINPECS